MMKIVYKGGKAEIVEKKSHFIATVSPAESETEALDFIASVKKKYRDATHNCSAYTLGEGQELQHCSDDGEPNGTAGKPMLDVLTGQDIHNAVVVVTRYFGGTLLGTGGLVRAYSLSVQEGLKASVILERYEGVVLTVRTDYGSMGKIQYLLGQSGISVIDSEYTDSVKIKILIPKDQEKELLDAVTEATAGNAGFSKSEAVNYVIPAGKPVVLPVQK